MRSKHASEPSTDEATVPASEGRRRARIRRKNPPTRFRVVFAGPVGAGKTPAVRSLSDVATVDTDVAISQGSREADGDKTTTTVGLDYGVWKPTAEISVALVGTPGQQRFSDARGAVVMPNTRVLLWLRADRDEFAEDLDEWLERYDGTLHRVGIAVTRADTDEALEQARERLRDVLTKWDLPQTRIHAADPRDRDSVMRVVSMALDLPEETE